MNFPVTKAVATRMLNLGDDSTGSRGMPLLWTLRCLFAVLWIALVGTLRAADGVSAPTPGLLVATNSVIDTNQANVLDDKYHIAIGDQLSYHVLEDEDDPKTLLVTDSGELEIPYLGRFPAENKTCKQLSAELKVALEKKYYVQATVIIAVDSKPRSRGKVYLSGAIGAPGPEDITGDEVLTVSRAILRAGGLALYADGSAVQITRSTHDKSGRDKKIIVNVTRILEKGRSDEDIALQPDDFIYVPSRVFRF